MYTIISPASTDSFTSSLPICVSLITFSCLISMARTSNTILNRNDNNCTKTKNSGEGERVWGERGLGSLSTVVKKGLSWGMKVFCRHCHEEMRNWTHVSITRL